MFDLLFKANRKTERPIKTSAPSPVRPSAAIIKLPDMIIESKNAEASVQPPEPIKTSCLDDIFADIVHEQPRFAVHVELSR